MGFFSSPASSAPQADIRSSLILRNCGRTLKSRVASSASHLHPCLMAAGGVFPAREDNRTISTEQQARASTTEETPPSKHRPNPPIPLAPTKTQSAPQLSTSLSSSRFGSFSSTATEVKSPAARNLSAADSTILLILAFSAASESASRESIGSEAAIAELAVQGERIMRKKRASTA